MLGRDETSTPTQQVGLGNAFPFKADLFPPGIAFLGSCPDFPRNRDRLLDALRSRLGLCSWLLREFSRGCWFQTVHVCVSGMQVGSTVSLLSRLWVKLMAPGFLLN